MCAHSRSHAKRRMRVSPQGRTLVCAIKSVPRECVARRHDVCIAHDAAASCAAGYARGEDGSNQCPTRFYAIVNAAACETAATAAGKAYIGRVTEPNSPSGCFFDQWGGIRFNADAVGAGRHGEQLLCSGAARSRTLGLSTVGYHWGFLRVLWGLKEALAARRGTRLARVRL
jgi:hypothetical protein